VAACLRGRPNVWLHDCKYRAMGSKPQTHVSTAVDRIQKKSYCQIHVNLDCMKSVEAKSVSLEVLQCVVGV